MKKLFLLLILLSFFACKKDCSEQQLKLDTEYKVDKGLVCISNTTADYTICITYKFNHEIKTVCILRPYDHQESTNKNNKIKVTCSDQNARVTFKPDCQ